MDNSPVSEISEIGGATSCEAILCAENEEDCADLIRDEWASDEEYLRGKDGVNERPETEMDDSFSCDDSSDESLVDEGLDEEPERQPLIQLREYPVAGVLSELLMDKTTQKNIILGTDAYEGYDATTPVTEALLLGFESFKIEPRVCKQQEQQLVRTRNRAEVFTPSWVCNKMNNHCDALWFGRENVFNVEYADSWETIDEKIVFPQGKSWKTYIDSRRLEITCGEAPYVVSRYDAVTGKPIAVADRIGFLDRKMRVVGENTCDEAEWLEWTQRAFQSVYGYEFQGDSLLIARINLLVSFVDYMRERWRRTPTIPELKKMTNIIVWNFWQMDGLTGAVPLQTPTKSSQNDPLLEYSNGSGSLKPSFSECKIHDWRAKKSLKFNDLRKGL